MRFIPYFLIIGTLLGIDGDKISAQSINHINIPVFNKLGGIFANKFLTLKLVENIFYD